MTVVKPQLTEKVRQEVLGVVASMLVGQELATPRQAVAAACCLVEAMPKLLSGSKMFGLVIESEYEDTLILGDEVQELDVLSTLVQAGVLTLEGVDTYHGSDLLVDILADVSASHLPVKAEDGIQDRVFDVKERHNVALVRDALRIQEDTHMSVDEYVLEVNKQVVEIVPNHRKIRETAWAYEGCLLLEPDTAYVSEYKLDDRLRMYQAYRAAFCGQASDRERALMDFHGLSQNYTKDSAIKHLTAEMKDMGSWDDKSQFMGDFHHAVNDPVEFVIMHLNDKKDGGRISKPWSFMKAAYLMSEVRKGNRPYIGMGFGKDCKTSCAQMGGFLVSDGELLEACGFSKEDVLDAYERVIAECMTIGITMLTRNDVKKAFMAVLYGVSKMGLLSEKTILTPCYEKLYGGLDPVRDIEQMEAIAAKFYKAITKGFGKSLNRLRDKIKLAGMSYPVAGEEGICKYNSEVKYYLPDGSQVKMDYRVNVDIEGERVYGKNCTDVKVEGAGMDYFFESMKFKTRVKDLESQSRTGFVNLVQAVDGLLARLIIVKLGELGVKHVTAVHDCFRVGIDDVDKLDEAIKAAYHELFGSLISCKTPYLYKGTDITELYFEGTHKVTKPEFMHDTKNERMFYGKSGIRRLMEVGNIDLRECIDSLGEMNYFDK